MILKELVSLTSSKTAVKAIKKSALPQEVLDVFSAIVDDGKIVKRPDDKISWRGPHERLSVFYAANSDGVPYTMVIFSDKLNPILDVEYYVGRAKADDIADTSVKNNPF